MIESGLFYGNDALPEVNKVRKVIESKNAETQTKEMNENLGINIYMQTLIRENSWLFCEHCDYKSKSKKRTKNTYWKNA